MRQTHPLRRLALTCLVAVVPGTMAWAQNTATPASSSEDVSRTSSQSGKPMVTDPKVATGFELLTPEQDVISFGGLPAGTIPNAVFGRFGTGPVLVNGTNPAIPDTNAAVIFDSANPTGEDDDLGSPNEDFGGPGVGTAGMEGMPNENANALGNVIIVGEDLVDVVPPFGLVDDPDDADLVGAALEFDFSAVAPVIVHEITSLDVEADRPAAMVMLYNEANMLIGTVRLSSTGNNGVITTDLGSVPGVWRMVVLVNGSGAFDDLVFETIVDCNDNGIQDSVDIANGTSADCNANGIPDECEPDCDEDGLPDDCEEDCNSNGIVDDCEVFTDCNENEIPDECDIASGDSEDCNSNGIPDECEPDCNENDVPDDCDIADGVSADCNANGIPDECEPDCDFDGVPDDCEEDCNSDGTPDDCEEFTDCNGNQIPDECDVASGTSPDCNSNGIPDECEPDCNENNVPDDCDIADGTSNDCNSNGIPDECEPDCDLDGLPDACEPDCNSNGTPDDCEVFTDCNENEIPDECDIAEGKSEDCNSNGIPDECEPDCNGNDIPDDCDIADGTSPDCDGDGIPDECEPDCDNDGLADDCEEDCNSNGTPDDCEVFTDCNENEIPDECDIASGDSDDCNSNGIPDECEPDCNENDVPDDCDIADGTSPDCNSNGIPDECEPDCDSDGLPDDCEEDCNSDGTPDDCEVFTDCNENEIPDECDIASGDSDDCNSNGIPDECEPDCNENDVPDDCDIADGTSPDCNSNGIPDECEPDCDSDGLPDDCEEDCNSDGTPDDCEVFTDCNGNEIPDECDIASGTSPDCNSNEIPDECEPDCNDNGKPDDCDLADGTSPDCNSNGIPDECEPDCDSDGLPDDCEEDCNANGEPDDCEKFEDCNENGLPDDCDIANGSPDCDSNGIPDECDPDCDKDGLPDACEPDCNANGTPDDCEVFTDCNGNEIPDECDIADGTSPDCNSNDVPDECEEDCNSNGKPDDCDIADGTSPDCNSNGLPDECEPDCDNDGVPDDCEPDSDGDGIPDDCEECPPPADVCDFGCWQMLNTPTPAQGPPGYGLRMDGLFGDHPNVYTFDFEAPGTYVQLCYDDTTGTVTMSGVAYGGLDVGDDYDPVQQTFVDIDVIWTGAVCTGDALAIPHDGTGNGQMVWQLTGEVIPIVAKFSDGDSAFALTETNGGMFPVWSGWFVIEGDDNMDCCKDVEAFLVPVSECPPGPDCDFDGIPDDEETDCDEDGLPDDCETDCDGDGIPDDCDDDPGPTKLRCPSTAFPDPSVSTSMTSHALVLPGIGGIRFEFVGNATFVENADGTAALMGFLAASMDPNDVFFATIYFKDRVDPGDPGHPPAGSPKLELLPGAYVDQGGPIDPSTWHYYLDWEGFLVGHLNFEGAILQVKPKMPAFQVGVGANGKNLNEGASGWIDWMVLMQPDSGVILPDGVQGDINIDLGPCPPDTGPSYCLAGAYPDSYSHSTQGHSFWIEGERFEFSPLGEFTEYPNGTASITGKLFHKEDPTCGFEVQVFLADKVEPGDPDHPPAGSPKLGLEDDAYSDNGGPVDPDTFVYYETTFGVLKGTGKWEGALLQVERTGPSFQIGFGANVKNVNFGASGWVDLLTLEQPDTGPHFPQWQDADFNLDFVDCPDPCPPAASANALCHMDFSEQSGTWTYDQVTGMGLYIDENSEDIDWVSDEHGNGLEFRQYSGGDAIVETVSAADAQQLREALQATNAITAQVYFEMDNNTHTNGRLLSFSSGTAVSDRNFTMMVYPESDGENVFYGQIRLTTEVGTSTYEFDAPWGDDEFTVFAFTYDQNGDQMIRAYVNGSQVAAWAWSGGFSNWIDRPLQVGNEATLNRALRGSVWDVKIWNRALTGPELQAEAVGFLTD